MNRGLDQESLEPFLLPIVCDISEMKEDVKNVSSIQNMHAKVGVGEQVGALYAYSV